MTTGPLAEPSHAEAALFQISLAQWSLHRSFFGRALDDGFGAFLKRLRTDPDGVLQGKLDPLDFPVLARERFGIDAVEFVNTFFFGHAEDTRYLETLAANARSVGVTPLMIMLDALGRLGDPQSAERRLTVDRHKPWIDAAASLGCRAVRVNTHGEGTPDEQRDRVCEGLRVLGDYAARAGIRVLLENHGGLSSNAAWLVDVVTRTAHPAVGTLPDFGNFRIDATTNYDRYLGVAQMMPYAGAVSAKSHDFDANGNERTIDYPRMLGIVLDSGYRGYVGIEYEGRTLSEADGIMATKALLERVRRERVAG